MHYIAYSLSGKKSKSTQLFTEIFINKFMEFIDLHISFKINLVISSIPNYFNISETPITCFKYNKPIRSSIFNLNKIVTDKNIDFNTPEIVKILIIYIPLQGM